jgi:predicted amidohydrolase YtcJ
MSDGDRIVDAVAVTNGRITATGTYEAVRDASPTSAVVSDLGGGFAYPGFADSHVHVLNFGRSRMGVSCWPSEVDSVADIVRKVTSAHLAEPHGQWLKGRGYDPARLVEGRGPTATELDLPDGRCVVLDSFDFHRRVCNHAALASAGIDRNTPDPPGGEILRDAHGEPTGELIDTARALLDGVMPPWTADEDDEAIRLASRYFMSLGITHVTNAAPLTMARLGEEIAAFLRLSERGELPIRFASMMRIDLAAAAVDLGISPGFGDEWFRIGGLKIFADGALGPRTAYLDEPYDDRETRGSMPMDPEELAALIAPAAAAGWPVCVHAQGTAATRIVAAALTAHPAVGSRLPHRIEHCTLTDADTIQALAAGGITPVPQPGFLRFRAQDFRTSLGAVRLARMFPLRDWIDAGLRPIYSSDAPVIEDARPMPALATAVTRSDADGNVWGPDQAIDIDEAISMATTWAAAAAGSGHERGRIADGYLADFTVFDRSLHDVAPEDLAEVQPVSTIVAGNVAWSADS